VVGAEGGVDADALAVAMIDRGEEVHPGAAGQHGLGHVGAPRLVHPIGGDRAVVVVGGPLRRSVGRREIVLAHQPLDATFGGVHAALAQARPDLAVASP
jgi:hypothetical protein